jgi:Tfp pilus assembly PilM family ATPase
VNLATRVLVGFEAGRVAGAVVARRPGGLRLLARAEARLPEGALTPHPFEPNVQRPDAVRDALAAVYRSLGGNGRRATLVLPAGVARVALLEPPARVEPREYARYRLAPGLPFPAGEALVDGTLVAPGRFLAAAVRRRVVEAYERVAGDAGFNQDHVQLGAFAALSPFLAVPPQPGPSVALLLGEAACSLALFEDGRLVAFRSRRRDPGPDENEWLRDEVDRTALLGVARVAPAVCAVGPGATALVGELRREGRIASVGWGQPELDGAAEDAFLGAALG